MAKMIVSCTDKNKRHKFKEVTDQFVTEYGLAIRDRDPYAYKTTNGWKNTKLTDWLQKLQDAGIDVNKIKVEPEDVPRSRLLTGKNKQAQNNDAQKMKEELELFARESLNVTQKKSDMPATNSTKIPVGQSATAPTTQQSKNYPNQGHQLQWRT